MKKGIVTDWMKIVVWVVFASLAVFIILIILLHFYKKIPFELVFE